MGSGGFWLGLRLGFVGGGFCGGCLYWGEAGQ